MTNPPPLQPGRYYHIYNRGNNGENLFREERNYTYFLKLYADHIEPVADTYAYCLLKNHFHLLIRINETRPAGTVPAPEPSRAFSNLFNAYSKAINKAYSRTGSLFEHPYGRIEVRDSQYFSRLVVYSHQNPQRHRLSTNFRDWKYSSYYALVGRQATKLKREVVVGWFDNPENFTAVHQFLENGASLESLAPNDFD